jgi:hypothetical protein
VGRARGRNGSDRGGQKKSSERAKLLKMGWPRLGPFYRHETELTYLLTPWPLVRERTIPTERPPLVEEI